MRTTTTKNPVVHGIEKLDDTHTQRERDTQEHKHIWTQIHSENGCEGRRSEGAEEKWEKIGKLKTGCF